MIVIATDSTACLTKQEARMLGVIYVPMTYTVDGNTYTEHFSEDNGAYDTLIAGTEDLHTSQPAIGTYQHTFSALRRAGFEVLCLTISSRLSGTYNNASVCAAELDPENIRVVDTRTTAFGIAFLVREARRLIQSGYSLDETADAITQLRDQVKTLFSVGDMAPLRRSGRLGPVRQSIGTMLNIRPLLTVKDGTVVACGVARGRNDQLKSVIRAVPENAEEIMVQYIREEAAAKELATRLSEKCGKEVSLRKLGPVLGIHLGLDILGAIWLEPDKE
ncbi:MAG: DegV family protein [Clostridia bacterium]|nr:DegV family protein [Clostridia bacterium]